MNGRNAEARELFERLLGMSNDLELFSEEHDVAHQRLIGNFPQAFTHLTMVEAAKTLAVRGGPVTARYADRQPALVSPRWRRVHAPSWGHERSQEGL
jgi:hypothetical protein